MGTQKVGTHVGARKQLSTKVPKYFRSQMQLSPPQERSPLAALLGNPVELARRQAITRLGSIDHGFLVWWQGREGTCPKINADPDRDSSFGEYWTIGVGGRMLASYKQTTEEEWKSWSTKKESQWLGDLVSHLGFSLAS